jgi:hypothetical protein
MLKTSEKDMCIVCGRQASEKHHIKTKKAGGPDEDWNLLPVCRFDHVKIHTQGIKKIAAIYPRLAGWLLQHGWKLDFDGRKWRHYTPEVT